MAGETARESHRLREPVAASDWASGPASAPVTLVEYLDFQCPHCQQAYPEVERLRQTEGPHLRFVVRFFPLESEHPQALLAACAAEAAGRQGRFWEMYDLLFQNPGKLMPEDLRSHAQQLGLDLEAFEHDLERDEVRAKVRHQKLQGVRSGVNGTPTFFINEERYDGEADFAGLSAAVAKAGGASAPSAR